MANLGSLVATITANTKPFQQGMRRAKGSLGGFQEQTSKFNMRGMIAKLGLAAAAFAGMRAAVAQVKQQLTDLDNLGKTADKLGLGVQQLGQLRFAAEKSGVATATLDMAMQRMVRRVSEAAMGTGEAVKAIAELGISARDLAGQSPDEQMRTLADALKSVESPADRVRIAMKLFDSEGVALVNMLKDGSAALDEQGAAFDRLHGKLSRRDVTAIEAANDAWADLKIAIKGTLAQFTVAIAPVLTLLAKFTTGVVTAGRAVWRAFGRLFGLESNSVDLAERKRNEQEKLAKQQQIQADAAAKQLEQEKQILAARQKQADEMKRQGEAVRRQFLTPQERLQERVADLDRLVNAGAISWQTYERALAGAVKNLRESNSQQDKLASRQGIAAARRGTTAAYSAEQSTRRAMQGMKDAQQRQLAEQKKTNQILNQIKANNLGGKKDLKVVNL
tara:strand:+ start:94 stop:1437 length:1344 start_codon:yes stop_codon:yes gene_type:complete